MDAARELHMWFWMYTDQFGKRRQTTWRMTEEEARHYKDRVKVEGSLEVRQAFGNSGDFLKGRKRLRRTDT
jgi:hypothetical protein